MNCKHVALAIAAAAALAAAPSFAETVVQSGNTATVSSGTGVVITQPNDASVTVVPHTAAAVPTTARLLPGGTMLAYSSTTTLGGPGNAPTTRTETTSYWVNVPANAERRADFHRWQHLRN